MSEAIIIGFVNKGGPGVCGETMKNQLMIRKLKELGVKCYVMDFYKWRRHPWVFIQLLYTVLTHRKATIVFSTSVPNVYPMMRMMKAVGWKQHTVNWVIGGTLGEKTINGTFNKDVIGYINWTIVESQIMVEQLKSCGISNVIQVPNFKPIPYKPKINRSNSRIRFIFISRIIPDKGCDYILESAMMLNGKGLTSKYEIDFYGKIEEDYERTFRKKISELENVDYKGYLNLMSPNGYDCIASYDIMLFPTYWKGEGFAGVFIDAFIAGTPVIITDWAHNKQFFREGETAIFIPVHNVEALSIKMEECIERKYDLNLMATYCQKEADKYNIDNVINKELLEKIGLLG